MIFASDLDQTLIYSTRSMRLEEGKPIPSMKVVEQRGDRIISYMTDTAIELLKQVSEKIIFLPVTTRTVEQYRYITFFQNVIVPPIAVTSNGGNILIEGKVDLKWKKRIQNKLTDTALSGDDLLKKFSELANEEWVLSQATADDLFHYCIINKDFAPHDELADFKAMIDQQGWNMSMQGRKLYFVPKPVNKWDAVAYVKERMGKTFVATAGDSLLDLCMLEVADYAIAPLHGELSTTTAALNRTKQRGILASEEILTNVLDIYERMKQ
jgi:hydroxymethylpyrimidine pyrophosphatase-like HAD family hydrolase